MTDPTPTDPAPDVPVSDVPPPTWPELKDDLVAFLTHAFKTGKFKDEVTAFFHSVVADALAQLLADEANLMLPLTAWANGWMTQVRTDYSPGGPLEQTLKNAAHSVKIFLPAPDTEDGFKVVKEEEDAEHEEEK